MALSNDTADLLSSYPLWYFINDSIILLGNVIGISVACLFISTIIRLDHSTYSISNLIASNTCFAIGLTNLIMLFNSFSSLKIFFSRSNFARFDLFSSRNSFDIFYIEFLLFFMFKSIQSTSLYCLSSPFVVSIVFNFNVFSSLPMVKHFFTDFISFLN